MISPGRMHGVCCEGDSGFRFYSLEIPKTQSLRAFVLFVFDVGGCRLRGLAADRLEEEALMEQYTLMEQQAALRDRHTTDREHSMLQPAGGGAYYATR